MKEYRMKFKDNNKILCKIKGKYNLYILTSFNCIYKKISKYNPVLYKYTTNHLTNHYLKCYEKFLNKKVRIFKNHEKSINNIQKRILSIQKTRKRC